MRKVLYIAYDFPPRRTSGVYRTTNLAKELGRWGWNPTILTVDVGPGHLEDETLLQDFPADICVERSRDLNVSSWEKRAEVAIHAAGGLKSDYRQARQPFRDRMVRSGGHLFRSTIYFPDDTVGWIPLAFSKAIDLHMRYRFDLVFTSSPPRSAPVIALMLKRFLDLPWVAEYRDPWYPPTRPFRRYFERALLGRMLAAADAVVTTSQGLAAEFRASFGVTPRNVTVVNNGYNEIDFTAAANIGDALLTPEHFHFSHFGTVYPGFSGKFFGALRELIRESPELKRKVRVNIIGFPDDTIKREANSTDLKDIVCIHGFVDHLAAIAAMRASDCLLIFLGHREVARLAVAGKTYEYLRSGRPIIAVTCDGDTVELLRNSKSGSVVGPDDVQAIKLALRGAIGKGRESGTLSPIRREFVEQFRYDRLAGKLADIFNRVASHDS